MAEPPRPLSGWLMKRGAHAGAKRQGSKGWKKRWFAYDEERERLIYSQGPGLKPKGAIDVGDVSFVSSKARMAVQKMDKASLSLASKGSRPKVFRFEVSSGVGRGGRTFHLGAFSAEDCDRWLRQLLLRCRRRSLLLVSGAGSPSLPFSNAAAVAAASGSLCGSAEGSDGSFVAGSSFPDAASESSGASPSPRQPSVLSLYASFDDWGAVASSPSAYRSSPSAAGGSVDGSASPSHRVHSTTFPPSTHAGTIAAADSVWKSEVAAALQLNDFEVRASAIAVVALRVRTDACDSIISWCVQEHGEAIATHPDDSTRREWARLFRNASASDIFDPSVLRLILRLLVRLAQAGSGISAIESRLAALDALRQWTFLHTAAASMALDMSLVTDVLDVLRKGCDNDSPGPRLDASELRRWLDIIAAISYAYAVVPRTTKKAKGDRHGFLSSSEMKELEKILRSRCSQSGSTGIDAALPGDLEAIICVIRTNVATRSSAGLGGFRKKAASRLFSFRSSDTLDTSFFGDVSGLPVAQSAAHTSSAPSWLSTFIQALNAVLRPPSDSTFEQSRIKVEDIILPIEPKESSASSEASTDTTDGSACGMSFALSDLSMPSSGRLKGHLRFVLGASSAIICSISTPGSKEPRFVRILDFSVQACVVLMFAPHARSPSKLSFLPDTPPIVKLRIHKTATHDSEAEPDAALASEFAQLQDLCLRTVEKMIVDQWTWPNSLDLLADSLGALIEDGSSEDEEDADAESPVHSPVLRSSISSMSSSFLHAGRIRSTAGSVMGSQPTVDNSSYQEISVARAAAAALRTESSRVVSSSKPSSAPAQKKYQEYDYLPSISTLNASQEPPTRAVPATPSTKAEIETAKQQQQIWNSRVNGRDDPAACIAIFQFFAEGPKEVTLRPGDSIKVSFKHSSGWWKGQVMTSTAGPPRVGYFPSTFVCQ